MFVKLNLRLFAAVVFRAGIDDLTPIKISSVKGADKHLCCRNVRRYGNIVHIAESHKILLHLTVSYLGRCGTEIQKNVDLVIRYT